MKFESRPTAIALVLGGGISLLLAAAARPAHPTPRTTEVPLEFAQIYWEYNSSANDLGVHVSLDGEDWKTLTIERPDGQRLFEVRGRGPYQELGMTELFFEGAEPALDEFPLDELLERFPEGVYEFEGRTVDGEEVSGEDLFSHAIPAGPVVSAVVGGGNVLHINWSPVAATPPGFPVRPIVISGYQVIVGSFQVTLPPSATSVTVPPEFVASLEHGVSQAFEVLAIEQSANQSITEGTFVLP